MLKLTQNQIRQMVDENLAHDITNYNGEKIEKLEKQEICLKRFACSCGTYGINGLVVKGTKTNRLYAITARNNLIYLIKDM